MYFFIFSLALLAIQKPLEAKIKAVFWSNPTIIGQNRLDLIGKIGYLEGLMNITRAGTIQDEIFDKITKKFGHQTQQYKVNDPATNEPLPGLMRLWLTGEKSAEQVKKDALSLFKGDSFATKIIDLAFTPKEFLSVSSVIEDAFKLLKRFPPYIIHILASNYAPSSYKELENSKIGKRVLPSFKHIYNSGTLDDQHRGIVLQDPAFFKFIMNDLGLKPEECLVINSDPQVIKAAKSLGMHTIEHPYKDSSTIKKQLKQMHLIS